MVQLVAHRGQSAGMPENTLQSLTQAIACGAMAVEFDLQMTADQVPVLSHDISLQRTAGVEVDIATTGINDLMHFNVGERERLGELYAEVRIATLREVVTLLLASPQVTAFVELKDESLQRFGTVLFVQRVAELLAPLAGQCVVIADSLDALLVMRDELPLSVGWIVHRWDEADLYQARENGLDYLVINHKHCLQQRHDFATDPWQWVVYETCDPALAETLTARGIAWVESNDICAMLESLNGDI